MHRPKTGCKNEKAVESYVTLLKREEKEGLTAWIKNAKVKAEAKLKKYGITQQKIKEVLENGRPARSLEFDDEEKAIIKDAFLITMKPILDVANISEDDLGKEDNEYVKEVKKYASEEGNLAISLSVKVEEDLSTLEGDEEREMLEAYGLEESGLDTVVRASYDLLGLMSYLTAGKQECRAWTIKKGTKAPQAAGKIHTDFERGFIKAEIVSYNDLIASGSYQKAKEAGLVRLEGKEYIVHDGDLMEFLFNV